ncbi:hypothetical protein [Kineococcus sp. SYSU DK003]
MARRRGRKRKAVRETFESADVLGTLWEVVTLPFRVVWAIVRVFD